MNRADAEMRERIQSQHPDIVIVGGAHAVNLKDIAGYRVRDVSSENLPDDVAFFNPLDENSAYPIFSKACALHIETHDGESLSLIFRHLISLIGSHGHAIQELPALLETAIQREPEFFSLALRAFSEHNPELHGYIQPGMDIEFLKMPVEEAKRRIFRALQCSPA